jgi:phospholipid/cholesterol/gamma-HCH transport system substrate-binding protein
MMETKVNYAIVGIFVIVLGSALVAGILWIASGGSLQTKYDLYQAIEEESVAGLSINAPVKYNGVDVGKVKRIVLDQNNPQRVHLLLAIERGTPIKEDTVAVLKIQGLTGIAYMELDGGAMAAPPLRAKPGQAYPEIRTKPSLSARLETILSNVLSKLDSTTNNINAILSDDNRRAVSSALADIATFTHTLAARTETLDAAIADAARTMKNTAQISARVGPTLDRIDESAKAIERMGDNIAVASTSAGKTIDSVGGELQRFTGDALPELQRMMAELQVLAASLRRLSEQTERNPSSLIFGTSPVPPGPGESASKSRRAKAEPATPFDNEPQP